MEASDNRLPSKFLKAFSAAAEARIYDPGTIISKQGDLAWSISYIKHGSVSIMRRDEKSGKEHKVATLREGDFFGEVSFIFDIRRTASIIADEECEVLVLERSNARGLLQREPELYTFLERTGLKRWTYSSILGSSLLADLTDEKRQELVSEADIREIPPGSTLFADGRQALYAWFLISGMAEKKSGEGQWQELEGPVALNYDELKDSAAPTGPCTSVTSCIVAGIDVDALRSTWASLST